MLLRSCAWVQANLPGSSVINEGAEIKENWKDIGACTALEISEVMYCNCFKNDEKFLQVKGITTNATFVELAGIVVGEQEKERRAQTAASVDVDPNTTIALANAACKRRKAPLGSNRLPLNV